MSGDIRVSIIIASDKAYSGEREDKCGPSIRKALEGYAVVENVYILPDERGELSRLMRDLCGKADIILTSGGTGFSPRDITPEATKDVIEREVPGIPEAIRAFSMGITKNAMLSRGIAGIRQNTLIINLPGSPKAAAECIQVILPVLNHAVQTLRGEAYECASTH